MNPFHETKIHGQLSFPYIVYRGNIPEYIFSYPLHWHDEMEIIYIKSGQGIVTVQSRQYMVKANDIVVILPQMIHSIAQYGNSNMEYFNILFRFSLLTCSANDACYDKYFKPLYYHTKCPTPYIKASTTLNQILYPYITFLIENRKSSYTENELMVKSNLFAIIHYLNQYSSNTSNAKLSQKNNYDKLKHLLSYVYSNYRESISIQNAAKICGFSTSHFMKIFKELTGESFSQYLLNYRLEMAAKQLQDTSNKIIDIAENTGFHNLSYFTRTFKKKYGLTPSAYKTSKK